jgi:hypothetical protein
MPLASVGRCPLGRQLVGRGVVGQIPVHFTNWQSDRHFIFEGHFIVKPFLSR